jgi:hypothetical protein
MQNGQETYTDRSGLITLEVYDRLVAQNRELEVENMYLKQELAQLKRMIFGSKSERHMRNKSNYQNEEIITFTYTYPAIL